MTDACVSELQIDRLLAAELAPLVADAARSHAAGCTSCGERLRHAEELRRQFAAHPPPLRLPSRRRAVAVAAGGIAAIAVVALVAFDVGRGGGGDPGVRSKGGAVLGFFVEHSGELRRGRSGEPVVVGDRLQLVTTADAPGWIAVTGVDGAGSRTVYAAPQPLPAGRERPLPFSLILDATPGVTTITAVVCARPFALESPPADCAVDAFTIETRP